MATLKEIRKAQESVRARIAKEIKERPDIGPYEFLISQLQSKGIETSEIVDMDSAHKAINSLKRTDRIDIRRNQKMYNQEYFNAMEEVNKGNFELIKKLPQSVVKLIAKGAAYGTGVAGVVNTITPNLFPTLVGYYAGSAPVNALTKLGLVSIGAFSTPAIAQGAVLAVGAAAGVATYAVGKGIVEAGKAIHKKVQKNKESNNEER